MPDNVVETQTPAARGETAPSEFDRFFEITLSPMIVAGLDGYMKRINRACEQMAGFTADELRSAPFLHFIHPDDRENAELAIMEMVASGVGREVDVRVLCKNGEYKWTEWMGTPYAEQQLFYLIGKDVTENHRTQEALQARVQADRDLELFFTFAPDVMFVGGFDGSIKRVNSALETLSGFTREQLLSKSLFDFICPDDAALAVAALTGISEEGVVRDVEARVRCADGSYKRFVWNAAAFKDRGVFYAIGTDVTARRAAEEALIERAKQQEAVAALGQRALAGGELDPLMQETVAAVARTLKADLAEIRQLQPDGRETILKAGVGWREGLVGQAAASVEPDTVGGYVLTTNQPVTVEDLPSETRFHGSPLLAEHGAISGMACPIPGAERPFGVLAVYCPERRTFTADDVHFLQAVANTLAAAIRRKEAEEDLNLFFDNSPDLMIVAGFDGYVKRVNRPTGSTNYLDPEVILNQPYMNFYHPDDREGFAAAIRKLVESGLPQSFEVRALMKDGAYDWITYNAAAFPERQLICAVGHNTTYRHRVEEALGQRARQQQAVAELGGRALAGGDLTVLMNETVTLLARTLEVEFAEVREFRPDANEVVLRAALGWKRDRSGAGAVSAGLETASGYMLSTQQPVIIEDLARETRFQGAALLREHGVVSGIGCVIAGRELPFGVVAGYSSHARAFTEDDVHFLQAVANILAAAIERRRSEEQINRFFETSPDALAICGYDGAIKRLNRACLDISGFSPEDVKKMNFIETVFPDDRAAAEAEIRKLLAGGTLRAFEIRGLCKDGSYHWISWSVTPFPDWKEFYITGHIVTDRHLAEEALKERARQQQAVAELGGRTLASHDLAALMEDAATVLAKTLDVEYSEILELQPGEPTVLLKAGHGWKREEIGQVRLSAAPDTPAGRLLAAKAPLVVDDFVHDASFREMLDWHGQSVASGMGCLIAGAAGPYGIVGVHSTRRRRFSENDVHFLEAIANILAAAIERQRGEQERERFYDRTLAAMLIIGFDGVVKYANPAAMQISGYSREELVASPYASFVHPDDIAHVAETFPALMAGQSFHDFECRIRCKDGSYKWLSFDSAPDPDRQTFYAIAHDVTDRHRAEETLVERARQQEVVAQLGRRALAAQDLASLLDDAVKTLAQTLDLEYAEVMELHPDEHDFVLKAGVGWREEQIGQFRVNASPETLSGYVLSTKAPQIVENLASETRFRGESVLQEHQVVSGMACLIPGADRPYGVLAVHSSRARRFSENDLHFLEAAANILAAAIERKRGEQERERFFDRMLTPMLIVGYDGKARYVNAATAAVSGFTREELLSVPYISYVHPGDLARAAEVIPQVIAGKPFHAFELRIRCKDGSYRWFAFDSTSDPDRHAFYAIAHDVTDRHLAEDALAKRARQQEVVAQLGRQALAGGELTSLFDDAVKIVAETLEVEGAAVFELQPDSQFLLKAAVGWKAEQVGQLRVSAGADTVSRYLLEHKTPVLVEDLKSDSRFKGAPELQEHGTTSGIACLIPGAERPYGLIGVHSPRRIEFTENDVNFLEAASNILAAAIERRHAEEELNRFFEPSLNTMFVASFDGTVKRLNRAAELLTGYSREELTGISLLKLVRPDYLPAFLAEVQRLAVGGDVHAFETPIICKDGSQKWTVWSGISFPDWQVFYASGQDVTDRHLAEEALRASEETIRVIGDSALDAVILVDPDGIVEYWNPAAEKIFGHARDEMLGQPLHKLVMPGELHEQYQAGLAHFRETGEGPVIGKVLELEAMRKDGSRFPVEVSVASILLRDRWNAVGVVRDITQRKRDEAALVEAKQAAEAANRAKSEFLANMSHEIRTPMNGVIGLTSLVLDTELTKEQRQYLEGVMLSAEALLKIINDILDFSKIEAGRLELEKIDFDLRETLGNTMRTLAMPAHEKGLELLYEVRPEVPDALVGDPARLWQVLVNLVGNAIKFTDHGEVSVAVAVESLERNAVCLRFTVSDTGIGIAADKQRTLFRPFSQVDSSMSRKYGGTGLGLAISAQIVEMMKGRIWFESELGKGSHFHFTAWFDLRTTILPKRAPLPPSALDGLSVLVVDDNATNRMILRNMLAHWGVRPEEADGGIKGIEMLQAAFQAGRPFALILLDVMMPVMDGFAVLERLRQMPEIDRPVIMMLSSRDQPGDAARARALGAAAYIVKPIRPSELLDAIVRALGISFEPAAAKSGAALPAAAPPRGPKLRILVAEDNPINQMLALRLLEKAGHSVAAAGNGEEVLAAIARESFDLVLMDVQMPVMDGFEATALIRQQEKGTGRHLPIVAMTAHAMKGDREKCLEAGMDGYVAKPIERDELFRAIASVAPSVSAAAAAQEDPPAGPAHDA